VSQTRTEARLVEIRHGKGGLRKLGGIGMKD